MRISQGAEKEGIKSGTELLARLITRAWILLFFLLGASLPVYCQGFLTGTYTVADGLQDPTINDIAQDSRGIMWFATSGGVTAYDGIGWFNYDEENGLPDGVYLHVKTCKDGTIWAVPEHLNSGLYTFDSTAKDAKWQKINPPPDLGSETVQIAAAALLEIKRNIDHPVQAYLALGTYKNGLYVYNGDTGTWTRSDWTDNVEIASSTVYDIDTFNRTFYVVGDQGFFRVNPENDEQWERMPVTLPSLPVYALAVEKVAFLEDDTLAPVARDPRIWLLGREWTGNFREGAFSLFYNGGLPGFKSHQYYHRSVIRPDRFGGLWVGNRIILLNIDRKNHLKSFNRSAYRGTGTYCLYHDRESNLWVGNFRGATKIVSLRFENYSKRTGLYDDEVTAVCEMSPGTMVFGHNGGFTFLEDIHSTPVAIPGVEKGIALEYRVMDMCKDKQGYIWAAVSRIGVVRISPDRRMKWYKNLVPAGKDPYYSSVAVDSNGSVFASVSLELFRWERGKDRFVPVEPGTPLPGLARRMFPADDGGLYIATKFKGILHIKENRATPLLSFPGETGANIYSLHPYQEGSLLVGTNAGLYLLRDGKLEKFSREWFELDNPVYFITEDRDGSLWFGLNNGVVRWDGRRERRYTMQDGLAGNETNRAAGIIDSEGRMWIGTDMGVSCYIRDRDRSGKVAPLVEILSIEASGKLYSIDQPIALTDRRADLTFRFRGISFMDETSIKYNLKLEGYDRHWTTDYRSPGHRKHYANIPPGKYRFHLQAVNRLGLESDAAVSPEILVNKPFVLEPSFYFMLVLAGLLFISLIINYITRKRHSRNLESEVHQRTRQLEASEKELRNIFNTAHDGIIIFSPEGETVYDVNKRACKMYGFSRPEFIGMSMETISKDPKAGRLKVDEIVDKGGYQNFESEQYRKDGSSMIIEINASLINYRGEIAILSLNRDVTARKHAEEQIKRSLEEKVIMLKEIHHRVKNNLQIISSLLDLQSDQLDDPDVIRVFQDSKNRIRSMGLVHENLYQSSDMARIDTEDYIRSVVDYFFSTYGDHRGSVTPSIQVERISLDMDSAVPMGLILTELLSNALKHAFPPGSKGRIVIRLHSDRIGVLKLTVKDDGIGLPPEVNVKQTKTLGLQLVTLLTRQLRGSVEVERGEGTVFIITFPYSPPEGDDDNEYY